MTIKEAMDALAPRGWGIQTNGFMWLAGPEKDGVIEARAIGSSLETLMEKLEAEK